MFAHGVLGAQTSRVGCGDFYLPKRPCGFPGAACLCSANTCILGNRSVDCGWTRSEVWALQHPGSPGGSGGATPTPRTTRLMPIQTCPLSCGCALTERGAQVKIELLDSPPLNNVRKRTCPSAASTALSRLCPLPAQPHGGQK